MEVLISKGEKVGKVFLRKKINNLIQDIFGSGLVHKGYVCLEINAQPPDFTSQHPCFTKQEIKFRVLHYQAPGLDVFSPDSFQPYIIPGETRRKLRMWRNYALSLKKIENVYLLSKDSDTKL